jgi:hypothetical protein
MKVILTCGYRYSGLDQLQQALYKAGLKSARLFRNEQFSPEDLQKKILEANEDDSSLTNNYEQLNPGKLWQGLSTDLFIANLEQDAWGWADSNSLYLLNYWRDFDPRTRFILVYSSPAYALGQLLRGKESSTERIESLCENWFNVNTELLRFYNRNQERCLLVNVETFSSLIESTKLLTLIQERLAINLHGQIEFASSENDELFRLLTTSLIQEPPHIQALYQELESVSDAFFDRLEPTRAQLGNAFEQYGKLLSGYDNAIQLTQKLSQLEQELATEKQKPDLSIQLTQKISQLQQELAAEKQKPNLSVRLDVQEKENELLLLQLHQVQEELEHYFLENEKAIQGQAKTELVEQVVVDFRQFIDGDNWWNAEHDGRWAGPGLISNLRLPELRAGRYQIIIEIVDAIAPEILQKTLVSINEQPLRLVNTNPLSWLMRLIGMKKKYPVTLIGRVDLPQGDIRPVLEFKFPKVISPSSRGSQDMRSLALRIKTVELKLLKKL